MKLERGENASFVGSVECVGENSRVLARIRGERSALLLCEFERPFDLGFSQKNLTFFDFFPFFS